MLDYERTAGYRTRQRLSEPILPEHLRLIISMHPGPTAASLVDPHWRMWVASKLIRDTFRERGESHIGADIAGLMTENGKIVRKEWSVELVRPGSQLASVSFNDTSVLNPGRLVRRTWMPVEVDGDRYVVVYDQLFDVYVDRLPPLDLECETKAEL
ncbi:hypothetical protein [Azospirillum sp.]|uniref:hypothetical protein n=1 Tax=Azospirillum sp. TaxID=34012 RepID=UPI003D745E79